MARTTRIALLLLAAFAAVAVFVIWRIASPVAPAANAADAAPMSPEPERAPAPVALASVDDEQELETAAPLVRTETAAQAPALLVTVVGSREEPLAGAALWLVDARGERLWSAWADDLGQCVVPAGARLGAAFVHARAEQHFDAVEPLAPTASEVRITLESALLGSPSQVSGYVEYSDGVMAGAGVFVVLSQGRRNAPTSDEVLRLLSKEPVDGLQLASTDPRGRFAFEVDSQAGPFALRAGARGWSTRAESRATPGWFVGLRLHRLYGARVRLLDPDRAPLAVRPDTWGAVTVQLSSTASMTQSSDAELVLSGASPAELLTAPDVLRYVLGERSNPERSGPHELALRLPGYEPAKHAFDATPLGEGFAQHEVQLVRTAAGFGRLSVHTTDASEPLREALKDKTLAGTLRLLGTNGVRIPFPCELSLEAPTLIEGVPYGEYRVAFDSSHSLSLDVLSSLTVEQATTDLGVSLRDCGLARVTIRERGGRAVGVTFSCSLTWRANSATSSGPRTSRSIAALRAAPTVLAPLMAGEYELFHSRFEFGDTSGRAPFVVRAGELSEVEITLAP